MSRKDFLRKYGIVVRLSVFVPLYVFLRNILPADFQMIVGFMLGGLYCIAFDKMESWT